MNLEELRNQIDQIDEEMKNLFLKRMLIAHKIGIYKEKNNLPLVDEKREKEIMNRLTKSIKDQDLLPYYESFLRYIMKLSKDYQR